MSVFKLRPREVSKMLESTFRAGLTPMLWSSPGVGKSDILRQIAEKYSYKIIDMRLSQMDPTDLNGFATRNDDNTRSIYLPPLNIPLAGDPLEKGYKGWILFLDEITSSPPAIQSAAYKLILDRMVGGQKVHPKCFIAAAGNLNTDKAITFTMSTALQSRMAHFELEPDIEDWIKWANGKGIDTRLTSFLSWKSELLHSFDPNHKDKTFPCPRTWEFTSRLMKPFKTLEASQTPLYASVIGRAAAEELIMYSEVYATLTSWEDILADPHNAHIPTEPSAKYALAGTIAERMTPQNAAQILPYVWRLTIEFQILAMSRVLSKNILEYLKIPEIRNWTSRNSSDLMPEMQGV